MWILDALTGLIKKHGIYVAATLGTGYTNMKNRELLIKTQDAVWASGAYMPTYENGVETTYCNRAVNNVLLVMGYAKLDGMSADQIMDHLRASPDFQAMDMRDCQFAANLGTVIVVGLKGAELGQSHGHVCTLTPGAAEYSGHWASPAPACLSIGRRDICFRSKGVNWAFVPKPEFWAWKESL